MENSPTPRVKVCGAQNRNSQMIYENNTCHDRPFGRKKVSNIYDTDLFKVERKHR